MTDRLFVRPINAEGVSKIPAQSIALGTNNLESMELSERVRELIKPGLFAATLSGLTKHSCSVTQASAQSTARNPGLEAGKRLRRFSPRR